MSGSFDFVTAIITKSAFLISSGSPVNAMFGLSFAWKSSRILPASTSKPIVVRCRGDTAECKRQSDVAETGDADGSVAQVIVHLKTPAILFYFIYHGT